MALHLHREINDGTRLISMRNSWRVGKQHHAANLARGSYLIIGMPMRRAFGVVVSASACKRAAVNNRRSLSCLSHLSRVARGEAK